MLEKVNMVGIYWGYKEIPDKGDVAELNQWLADNSIDIKIRLESGSDGISLYVEAI